MTAAELILEGRLLERAWGKFRICVAIFSLLTSISLHAVDQPNYDEHIKPILRQHCLKCHGNDKQKADLNLQSYETTMTGGSGGQAVVPGRASQSLLYEIIVDPDDDIRMPPNKPMIPKQQIDLIQKWIDSGVRENSGSKSLVKTRDTSFSPMTSSTDGKPENPAMPENLPEVDLPKTVRSLPVLTMATSPWAPLLAVAGQEHIKLFHIESKQQLGLLPFPEGVPHVIRFSRDGAVLMVAGGRPVESGSVVLYDVKSGSRLTSIGDELDAIIAADLSPDQKLVAIGGTNKVVKVYSTENRKQLYQIDKHTDWVTTTAFSPDGKMIATADRAGGLHLWDANSGGIILSLLEHKASVRALSWRADSKFLASVGEDGRVIWWDVKDGWPTINKNNAHPPHRPEGTYGTLPNGVLTASFGTNGNLVTAGRDQCVRIWDTKGKQIKSFKFEAGLPISAVLLNGGKNVATGDSLGILHFGDL